MVALPDEEDSTAGKQKERKKKKQGETKTT